MRNGSFFNHIKARFKIMLKLTLADIKTICGTLDALDYIEIKSVRRGFKDYLKHKDTFAVSFNLKPSKKYTETIKSSDRVVFHD